MELLTSDQIRDQLPRKANRLTGRGSRYNIFEEGRQSTQPSDGSKPSILLHLRNAREEAVTDRDALDLEVQNQITSAPDFRLRDLGFDVFGNAIRKYWGNQAAVRVVNEWNAAIIKGIGGSNLPAENCTWFVEYMIRYLGFDYTTIFGTQRQTFEQLLKWVQLLLTSRFREWWARMRPDQTQDSLYPGRDEQQTLIDYSQYANDLQHQGGFLNDILLVQSGRFILRDNELSEDPDQRTWAERVRYSRMTFQGGYRMTPEQALRIWTAGMNTNKPNLADIFTWALQLLEHFGT
ncbi:hypothetical protein F5Y08DRAFT_116466 [Xylaria arbuscula]|nr:hypothetical protein F5Y08DRAFT_116466 [Xylaria arbuscula]